jgi:hypothetical protein
MGRGRVARGRTRRHKGLATAGLVLGLLSLLIVVAVVVLVIVGVNQIGGFDAIRDQFQSEFERQRQMQQGG